MPSTGPKYSIAFAIEVFLQFERCYPRATKFLDETNQWSRDQAIRDLCNNQGEWERYKIKVKFYEKAFLREHRQALLERQKQIELDI